MVYCKAKKLGPQPPRVCPKEPHLCLKTNFQHSGDDSAPGLLLLGFRACGGRCSPGRSLEDPFSQSRWVTVSSLHSVKKITARWNVQPCPKLKKKTPKARIPKAYISLKRGPEDGIAIILRHAAAFSFRL